MNGKFYIEKIIRDDGQTFAFDESEIYLAEKNTLLTRPDPTTTSLNFTEANGGEMIRQQNGIYTQTINGLIIPRQTEYWTLTQKLANFFEINHTFRIIYIRKNGARFSVPNCWIDEGLQIEPLPYEDESDFSLTMAIGGEFWREYAEDESGTEKYSNSVKLSLISANSGGETWDSVGETWDSVGAEWEAGSGGVQVVSVASSHDIWPVWTVTGPCTNPTLTNNTTQTSATFSGSLANGQTLTVDFEDGSAHIGTAVVTRMVTGYVQMQPGNNMVGFDIESGTTETSLISWNNIVN